MYTTFNLIIIILALLGVLGFALNLWVRTGELESRIHFLERDKYIRDNFDGDIDEWKKATLNNKKKEE